MKETNDFLMPEYYSGFRCKMGECRTACCVGWPISVSLENYFKLIGMECSPELRSKLDVGLRMTDHPTPDHYACFNPRYDGNCPMRMEDGRCLIHAEKGEDALADVCRLFPRGIRVDGVHECSCSNSCEAVAEIFLGMREPMRFVKKTIAVEVPDGSDSTGHVHTEAEQEKRMAIIAFLQSRDQSLAARIADLGRKIDKDVKIPRHSAENGELYIAMVKTLAEHHDSIADYAEEAISCLTDENGAYDWGIYERACAEFEARFPQWEIFFEHLIVNHIFFSRFPITERKMAEIDVWKALVLIYALLRFIAVGYTVSHPDEAGLVDAVSACFRMIDHTDFTSYAAALMKKYALGGNDALGNLLGL